MKKIKQNIASLLEQQNIVLLQVRSNNKRYWDILDESHQHTLHKDTNAKCTQFYKLHRTRKYRLTPTSKDWCMWQEGIATLSPCDNTDILTRVDTTQEDIVPLQRNDTTPRKSTAAQYFEESWIFGEAQHKQESGATKHNDTNPSLQATLGRVELLAAQHRQEIHDAPRETLASRHTGREGSQISKRYSERGGVWTKRQVARGAYFSGRVRSTRQGPPA